MPQSKKGVKLKLEKCTLECHHEYEGHIASTASPSKRKSPAHRTKKECCILSLCLVKTKKSRTRFQSYTGKMRCSYLSTEAMACYKVKRIKWVVYVG